MRWKIKLKKLVSYEDAVEKSKGREWKNQRMAQLGPPAIRPVEVKKWETVQTLVRETIPAAAESQTIQPSSPPMSPSSPPLGEAEELQKDM